MRKTALTLADLRRQGFVFKKRLGQHFLLHRLILDQIADGAAIEPSDLVIEIGAGAGTLTEVLAERARRVLAIELDRDLVPFLRARFAANPQVEILAGDALDMDIDQLAADAAGAGEAVADEVAAGKAASGEVAAGSPAGAGQPRQPVCKIAANLPYQISAPFLTGVFRRWRSVAGGVVTVQKEVAKKIIARPGEEGYGLLSLAAAWYGQAEIILELPPAYFTPPAPVDSAAVAFRRRRETPAVEEQALWRLIQAALGQRRKTLGNALKSLTDPGSLKGMDWRQAANAAGIDLCRRGETLSLDEFIALAQAAEAL
ncbi:MAG: 16S rRNA (adenine(1518)-N(6)/adenine(1519)-N(6))-dimethyltransferase [Peptococcaceae bacterium]|jgi:16S rRNA (adenine1518-N6/adenine1519-N6)-dimethyltransferase|nr:16S rRNA (adenine(1518)-N(6)/adenine(1519)-N(6))-dimethyltransferase [Peptococcaceae bacterium]